MPTVLEDHQQRAEDIKSGIQTMLTRYSEVASKLSSSCSSAMNDTAAFVSSAFISPRHDEVEQEKVHIMLQEAEYKNPVDEFRTARPLLGLGPEGSPSIILQVVESCKDMSGKMAWSIPEDGTWLDPVFKLERSCMQSYLSTLLRQRNTVWKLNFLKALFWSDLPLIAIADSDARKYAGGIPRAQMTELLDRFIPSNRRGILSITVRILEFFRREKGDNPFSEISHDLTHREDTENIIKSVWRKWYPANDCTLPEGVERTWESGYTVSKLIWTKTGKPYTPKIG
ncbi:hypothetical protein M408DRAFT_123154 [Serendipita vermifera MAFF 305830]|uniref:Uncharacterized protein n=1 Tax=Serendipita vermifera MAFF 305830 TaxID=933852 RepID=A0A0C2W2T8_SERVB|nr:hypothetical protein M408DRAFT_123154 [Serendipita vermifera MAFF 305830]